MRILAGKSTLRGTVRIPSSKSHTIRAVAIASLASGESEILNPLVSSDTRSAVDCYRTLGARIDTGDPQRWTVVGNDGMPRIPSCPIDVGNSGTTLRIAMGTAGLIPSDRSVRFTGDEQLRARPVAPLMDALQTLGARCASLRDNGRAPVTIRGQISGGRVEIACTTSQYLTSLLLCTPLANGDTEIVVTSLNEPGYVRMTLDWLDREEIAYEHEGLKRFTIRGGQRYRRLCTAIPADFSSATFFLCAAALVGQEVKLVGLDFSDSQPDRAVIGYLQAMGADIRIESDTIVVRSVPLTGTEIDMNATPDALPAMAVTAAFAEGETRIVNVKHAREKETDRIRCMVGELLRMGVDATELPDGMIVRRSRPEPSDLHGHADHRIVMALSLAAMAMDGETSIDTAEAVDITFPAYVDLMRSIGANMRTE